MESLLTSYQRSLLEILYRSDVNNRDKCKITRIELIKSVNVIISKNIKPHLKAEQYMDKEDNENELKQGISLEFQRIFTL